MKCFSFFNIRSDGRAVFLFLRFCLVLPFSIVKSILRVSFSAGRLTTSNEDLFISELSEKISFNE